MDNIKQSVIESENRRKEFLAYHIQNTEQWIGELDAIQTHMFNPERISPENVTARERVREGLMWLEEDLKHLKAQESGIITEIETVGG